MLKMYWKESHSKRSSVTNWSVNFAPKCFQSSRSWSIIGNLTNLRNSSAQFVARDSNNRKILRDQSKRKKHWTINSYFSSRVARHMTVHNKTIKSTIPDKPNEPNTVLVQSKPVVKNDPLQFSSDVKASSTIDDQEDQTDGQLECDFCDKKFEVKKSLMDHRRNVHLPKRHKCSICSKSFITR